PCWSGIAGHAAPAAVLSAYGACTVLPAHACNRRRATTHACEIWKQEAGRIGGTGIKLSRPISTGEVGFAAVSSSRLAQRLGANGMRKLQKFHREGFPVLTMCCRAGQF